MTRKVRSSFHLILTQMGGPNVPGCVGFGTFDAPRDFNTPWHIKYCAFEVLECFFILLQFAFLTRVCHNPRRSVGQVCYFLKPRFNISWHRFVSPHSSLSGKYEFFCPCVCRTFFFCEDLLPTICSHGNQTPDNV